MVKDNRKALEYFFPEVGAGGFTRTDGTIEFYNRVNALLAPDMTVLDFGAGRGAGHVDDPVTYRRKLRNLKGKCAKIIGTDVESAVLENTGLDEAVVIQPGKRLPIPDQSVDMIISDSVFEHVAEPEFVARELDRVLKPRGWLLARTPNKWGYIGVGSNLVPNKWHSAWLRRLQPERKGADVFPTTYRLNTRKALKRYFPTDQYDHYTYGYFPEPAYFGNSRVLWRLALLVFRCTPMAFAPMWIVPLRKQGISAD